jgi:hypothetical protein
MAKRPVDDPTVSNDASTSDKPKWLTPGVWGIGLASFLADVGHEVPTALFASFVTITLGAPAAILGLIEGLADGLAGLARFTGGALARRRLTEKALCSPWGLSFYGGPGCSHWGSRRSVAGGPFAYGSLACAFLHATRFWLIWLRLQCMDGRTALSA